MSDEFIAALALTERVRDYEAAIRSFDQAIVNGDEIRRERDDALALLAAVRVACDGAESEGQHHITIEAIRAAMGQAMREQAVSATNGRKGTELRQCDSKPVAVESEVGTNRKGTP